MRFGHDDEHLALRDAVRDLLDRECGPVVVRAAGDAPPGRLDRSVWDRLTDMGVPAAAVPEEHGGHGLDERSLVLVLEETGRAGLPHPVVDAAAVAAPLLAGHPGGEKLARGAVVASDLGGPNVPCAADADLLLLEDTERGGVHLVDPGAPDVTLTPLDTVDRARRAARVRWTPEPGTRVTDDPAIMELARDRGRLGTAAQLLGLGQRMLDMTVSHVSQRHQFGRPVGSFQAVKHMLADALKELAFARPAVHRAAHSVAVGAPARARDVSMAKAMASEAASLAGRHALQCHGAIGYTVEADLHLYLKRSWALERAWGDPTWHRRRVGQHIIGDEERTQP